MALPVPFLLGLDLLDETDTGNHVPAPRSSADSELPEAASETDDVSISRGRDVAIREPGCVKAGKPLAAVPHNRLPRYGDSAKATAQAARRATLRGSSASARGRKPCRFPWKAVLHQETARATESGALALAAVDDLLCGVVSQADIEERPAQDFAKAIMLLQALASRSRDRCRTALSDLARVSHDADTSAAECKTLRSIARSGLKRASDAAHEVRRHRRALRALHSVLASSAGTEAEKVDAVERYVHGAHASLKVEEARLARFCKAAGAALASSPGEQGHRSPLAGGAETAEVAAQDSDTAAHVAGTGRREQQTPEKDGEAVGLRARVKLLERRLGASDAGGGSAVLPESRSGRAKGAQAVAAVAEAEADAVARVSSLLQAAEAAICASAAVKGPSAVTQAATAAHGGRDASVPRTRRHDDHPGLGEAETQAQASPDRDTPAHSLRLSLASGLRSAGPREGRSGAGGGLGDAAESSLLSEPEGEELLRSGTGFRVATPRQAPVVLLQAPEAGQGAGHEESDAVVVRHAQLEGAMTAAIAEAVKAVGLARQAAAEAKLEARACEQRARMAEAAAADREEAAASLTQKLESERATWQEEERALTSRLLLAQAEAAETKAEAAERQARAEARASQALAGAEASSGAAMAARLVCHRAAAGILARVARWGAARRSLGVWRRRAEREAAHEREVSRAKLLRRVAEAEAAREREAGLRREAALAAIKLRTSVQEAVGAPSGRDYTLDSAVDAVVADYEAARSGRTGRWGGASEGGAALSEAMASAGRLADMLVSQACRTAAGTTPGGRADAVPAAALRATALAAVPASAQAVRVRSALVRTSHFLRAAAAGDRQHCLAAQAAGTGAESLASALPLPPPGDRATHTDPEAGAEPAELAAPLAPEGSHALCRYHHHRGPALQLCATIDELLERTVAARIIRASSGAPVPAQAAAAAWTDRWGHDHLNHTVSSGAGFTPDAEPQDASEGDSPNFENLRPHARFARASLSLAVEPETSSSAVLTLPAVPEGREDGGGGDAGAGAQPRRSAAKPAAPPKPQRGTHAIPRPNAAAVQPTPRHLRRMAAVRAAAVLLGEEQAARVRGEGLDEPGAAEVALPAAWRVGRSDPTRRAVGAALGGAIAEVLAAADGMLASRIPRLAARCRVLASGAGGLAGDDGAGSGAALLSAGLGIADGGGEAEAAGAVAGAPTSGHRGWRWASNWLPAAGRESDVAFLASNKAREQAAAAVRAASAMLDAERAARRLRAQHSILQRETRRIVCAGADERNRDNIGGSQATAVPHQTSSASQAMMQNAAAETGRRRRLSALADAEAEEAARFQLQLRQQRSRRLVAEREAAEAAVETAKAERARANAAQLHREAATITLAPALETATLRSQGATHQPFQLSSKPQPQHSRLQDTEPRPLPPPVADAARQGAVRQHRSGTAGSALSSTMGMELDGMSAASSAPSLSLSLAASDALAHPAPPAAAAGLALAGRGGTPRLGMIIQGASDAEFPSDGRVSARSTTPRPSPPLPPSSLAPARDKAEGLPKPAAQAPESAGRPTAVGAAPAPGAATQHAAAESVERPRLAGHGWTWRSEEAGPSAATHNSRSARAASTSGAAKAAPSLTAPSMDAAVGVLSGTEGGGSLSMSDVGSEELVSYRVSPAKPSSGPPDPKPADAGVAAGGLIIEAVGESLELSQTVSDWDAEVPSESHVSAAASMTAGVDQPDAIALDAAHAEAAMLSMSPSHGATATHGIAAEWSPQLSAPASSAADFGSFHGFGSGGASPALIGQFSSAGLGGGVGFGAASGVPSIAFGASGGSGAFADAGGRKQQWGSNGQAAYPHSPAAEGEREKKVKAAGGATAGPVVRSWSGVRRPRPAITTSQQREGGLVWDAPKTEGKTDTVQPAPTDDELAEAMAGVIPAAGEGGFAVEDDMAGLVRRSPGAIDPSPHGWEAPSLLKGSDAFDMDDAGPGVAVAGLQAPSAGLEAHAGLMRPSVPSSLFERRISDAEVQHTGFAESDGSVRESVSRAAGGVPSSIETPGAAPAPEGLNDWNPSRRLLLGQPGGAGKEAMLGAASEYMEASFGSTSSAGDVLSQLIASGGPTSQSPPTPVRGGHRRVAAVTARQSPAPFQATGLRQPSTDALEDMDLMESIDFDT